MIFKVRLTLAKFECCLNSVAYSLILLFQALISLVVSGFLHWGSRNELPEELELAKYISKLFETPLKISHRKLCFGLWRGAIKFTFTY